MPKTITVALKAELTINDGEVEYTITLDYDSLADHLAQCQAVFDAMALAEVKEEE